MVSAWKLMSLWIGYSVCGGLDFIMLGLIVVFSNFAIVMVGVKLIGMEPGYADAVQV